jgi:hypothetical protein
MIRSPRCFVALLCLVSATFAEGSTRTWTGGTGGNWTTPANWGGVAPVAGDDLVFPSGTPFTLTNNDFPADTQFQSISVQADQYNLSGNEVLLGAGGLSAPTFFPFVHISFPISLAVSQTWQPLFSVMGDIDLNGHVLTLDPLNIAGFFYSAIRGTGSVVQTNTGGILFAGVNTFAGTFIHTGSGSTSLPGFFGGRLDAPYTQTDGALDISSDETVGDLFINGGKFSVGAGSNGPTSARGNSGNVTLNAAARYSQIIESSSPNGFGTLHVTGSVTLGGATLQLLGTGNVNVGDQLMIIDNDGVDPVVGTFAGLPEGAIMMPSPGSFRYLISYAGGTGNDVTLTALPGTTPTTTTLQSSRNPSPSGAPITFTATVAGGNVTGIVTYYDGATSIGTSAVDNSGITAFTTSAFPPGSHAITAAYSGDRILNTSTSSPLTQVVLVPTPALGPMAAAALFLALALVGVLVRQ